MAGTLGHFPAGENRAGATVERFIATFAFRSHRLGCEMIVAHHIDAIDQAADDFETAELT